MTDDLPFGEPQPESAVSLVRSERRHRHQWTRFYFLDGDEQRYNDKCLICGAIRDEAKSRRGNNNRKRGQAIQRKRIQGLGGLNLAGNNENLDGIGGMFAFESKSGTAFSDRYWRWLKGIPNTGGRVGVLIVTDAPGPGRKARSFVVVDYDDWRDLHGE